MKKKTKKAIWVIIFIVALIIIGCIIYLLQPVRHAVPIDKITGIYTSATLKPGCTITHGKPFTAYPDSVPKHNQPSEIPTEDKDPVLSVSDIRIIDVYGLNCSIIFIYNEDQQLYVAEDYPLSNLDYDALEVLGANDGIKSYLKGTGYTLRGAPSRHVPRILVIIIPVILIVAAVLLQIGRAKNKYKKEKEQGW